MSFRASNVHLINKNLFKNCLSKRSFSIETSKNAKDHYKLLVIGGGTGGLAVSSKLVKKLGNGNVGLVDSCDWHCKYLFYVISIISINRSNQYS